MTTTTDRTYYFVDSTTTGINVKPDLRPSSLVLVNPEIIRTNSYINAKTSWVINFRINKNPVDAGGMLSVEVPDGVMMYMGETPLVENYTSDVVEIRNISYKLHPSGTAIKEIMIPNFCESPCLAGKAYSIKIDRFRNPTS